MFLYQFHIFKSIENNIKTILNINQKKCIIILNAFFRIWITDFDLSPLTQDLDLDLDSSATTILS